MDAPTTEWRPASDVEASIHHDAATIVDAALGAARPTIGEPTGLRPTTMDTKTAHEQDASTIVDAVVDGLTEGQRAILDFERRWWRQAGAKEQAIRETFSMTPTRYYQTLNALLDLPGATSYDAALVHRLQRLRGSTARGRRVS